MRRLLSGGSAVALCIFIAGCGGSGSPTIAGVWQADDGSGTKTIGDDGTCSGMYYNQGEPLDIGGGMTCTLGSKSTDDSYTLVVEQPPNQTSYEATFPDEDTMTLSQSGTVVVTLSRQ